jgi:hypothetical protein
MHESHLEALLSAIESNSFTKIDLLSHELLSELYRELLNPKLSNSHRALNALIALQQCPLVPPEFQKGIQYFLQNSRDVLLSQWRLYKDFNHAIIHQHGLHTENYPDVVSMSLRDQPELFRKLLRQRLIYPSCFNSAGLSLVYLGVDDNQIDIVCELVSMMTPEQILTPASIISGNRQETIFELAVRNEQMFRACWTQLESRSDQMLWGTLDQRHLTHVCRFATFELVDRMLSRGLDLASVLKFDPLHVWIEIALYHPSPTGLFERFSHQGHYLPSMKNALDTPLLAAARHDRAEATSWLLFHSTDMNEQLGCAVDAARRQTAGSIQILQMTIKRISLRVPAPPANWVQNLAFEVIHGASNRSGESQLESVDIVEHRAIQKIGFAMHFAEDSLLFPKSMLLVAREANLSSLVEYLQTLNDEARSMLALELPLYSVHCQLVI